MTNPSPSDDELAAALHALSRRTHPRREFSARLRSQLETVSAQPHSAWNRWTGFAWARPYLFQAAVVLLLIGLVGLAFRLTPHLLGQAPVVAQVSTPTPMFSGPATSDGQEVPAGVLARLGKGSILKLDTAPDGRLAVGSTASLCVYNPGLTVDWCLWPKAGPQWLGFDPKGRYLAVKYFDGRVQILDAASGAVVREAIFDQIKDLPLPNLAWDPTGAMRLALSWTVYNGPQPIALTATPTGVVAAPPAVVELPTADPNGKIQTVVAVWDWEESRFAWGPVTVRENPSVEGGSIWALAWAKGSGGESVLALGGRDGLVLLDGATGEIKHTYEPTWQVAPVGDISTLDLSADGQWLAYGYPGGLSAFKLSGWEFADKQMWQTKATPDYLRVSPDGKTIAVHEASRQVQLFDLEGNGSGNHPPQVTLQAAASWALAFSSRSTWFYVDEGGALASYSPEQSGPALMDYTSTCAALAWTQSTELGCVGQTLVAWDASKPALARVQLPTVVGEQQSLLFLALSNNGSRWALRHSIIDQSPEIVVLDTTSNQPAARFKIYTFDAVIAAFSPDGNRLAVASHQGPIDIYSVETGEKLIEVQAGPSGVQVNRLAWGASLGPESDPIAFTWQDQNGKAGVSLLDASGIAAGSVRKIFEEPSQNTEMPLAFSPDGRLLALGTHAQLIIMDVSNGQEAYRLNTGSANFADAIAFSADGQRLAAGYDDTIPVWDLAKGDRPVQTFQGTNNRVSALAFSPDGRTLASALANRSILLWALDDSPRPEPPADLPTPTPLPLISGPTEAPTAAP